MDIKLEFQMEKLSMHVSFQQGQFYLTVLGKEQKIYAHTHSTKNMQHCNHFFRAR